MKKKLYRNTDNKIVGGVASGLATYFEVDVLLMRLAFVIAVLAGFSGILVYLILWIFLPAKPCVNAVDSTCCEENETCTPPVGACRCHKKWNNTKFILGCTLIFLGLYGLAEEFYAIPDWVALESLWPLIFIVLGIIALACCRKKKAIACQPENKNAQGAEGTQGGINLPS